MSPSGILIGIVADSTAPLRVVLVKKSLKVHKTKFSKPVSTVIPNDKKNYIYATKKTKKNLTKKYTRQ